MNPGGCILDDEGQLPPTARSQAARIKDSAIALDKNRTLGITIKIEIRKCDRI
ncbi:hypothetical protein QUA82_35455 [Microcoleus sp. F8-D3]